MGLQFPLSFGRHHNSKTWHSSDTQVLVWPATAWLVLEAGLPLWLSTGMAPSSAEMESTSSTASARRRGLLRLSPRPGTDGGDTVEPQLLAVLLSSDRTLLLQTTPLNRRAPPGDSTGAWSRGMLTLRLTLTMAMVEPTLDTAMAVWAMAMAVWAMDMAAMARGLPTLRPTLTMATVALTPDTATVVWATAIAVWATAMAAMARGLPTLRPMLTMATVALTPDTATAVWATAMEVSATDMAAMARDLPTLRPTLTTAMVALTLDTATGVWATAMVVSATDMASVPLTPMPTTAMAVTADTDLDTPLATVMVDTATSDKSAKGWCRELQPMKICSISKLEIGNKSCSLEIRYFLMCIFMDKKQNVIKNEK